jgi:hypothetical protein
MNRAEDEPQAVKEEALKSIETLSAMGENAARWMISLI